MDKPIISGDTIRVPSSQEFLPDVDMFIEGILRGFGTDESVIADIAISVSEVVNNAIVHGNRLQRELPVIVRITKEQKKVRIFIKDSGGGFDPTHIDNPIDDNNLLKEVGRGIFIVNSLMDSVDVHHNDNGTEVIITKTIE